MIVGKPFNLLLPEASTGTRPFTYEIIGNELPDGIEFNEDNREMFGTPTAMLDTTEYQYQVTDSGRPNRTAELDFRIYVDEGLFPPTDVTVGATGQTSAELSWTAPIDGPAPEGYDIRWRLVDNESLTVNPYTGFISLGNVTSATITGLTQSRRYDFQVRSTGEGYVPSEWTDPPTGVVLMSRCVDTAGNQSVCPVRGLRVSDVGDDYIDLEWDDPLVGIVRVSQFQYQYREAGDPGYSARILLPSGARTTTISGLERATLYQIRMRTFSSSGSRTSPWTTIFGATEGYVYDMCSWPDEVQFHTIPLDETTPIVFPVADCTGTHTPSYTIAGAPSWLVATSVENVFNATPAESETASMEWNVSLDGNIVNAITVTIEATDGPIVPVPAAVTQTIYQ